MKKSQRTLLFILPFLVFFGLVLMFFHRLGKPTDVAINTQVSRPLPAFSLPLLSDPSRLMTNADLPKTAFLLNVWGSWCPTCKIEHPFLMELYTKGVPMVGVNYKDELPDALKYLSTYQDPFLYSLQDSDGSYALDLGLTGAPETFVVDGQGVVYQHILGEINAQKWQHQIEPCLNALNNSALTTDQKSSHCQGQP